MSSPTSAGVVDVAETTGSLAADQPATGLVGAAAPNSTEGLNEVSGSFESLQHHLDEV